jgi:hypothetical protein
MARIKLSGILSEISGSVSGMTFQNSLSGLTLRKKPIPLNPKSQSQLNQRNSLTYLQNLWFELSQVDRNKWIYFISWSNQSQKHNTHLLLSGFQLFIKYQSARLIAGLPVLTSFVFEPINYPLLTFDLYNSGSTFYALFSDWVSSDQYFFNLFLTPPVNVGTSYRNVGLRFMPVSYHVDRQYYLINPYLNAFGSLPSPNQQVNFRMYWFGINSPVLGFYQTGSKIIKTI